MSALSSLRQGGIFKVGWLSRPAELVSDPASVSKVGNIEDTLPLSVRFHTYTHKHVPTRYENA